MQEVFQANWTQSGHAYAALYAAEAFEILRNAHLKISAVSIGNFKKKIWHLDLPNGRVLFSSDFFYESRNEAGEKQISFEIWRNGKLRKKESDEVLYQLLHESAKADNSAAEVNIASLKTSEKVSVPRKLKRGKEILAQEKFSSLTNAIEGILRRDFSARPYDGCPTCLYYFICST